MRRRDERFATHDRHTVLPNPLHNRSAPTSPASRCFTPNDFVYDADARTCTCPAGKSLYRKGAAHMTKDDVGEYVCGAKRDGVPCTRRATCRRSPDTTAVRHVAFFRGRVEPDTRPPRETHTMRTKVDGPWKLYCLVHNIEKLANTGYAA